MQNQDDDFDFDAVTDGKFPEWSYKTPVKKRKEKPEFLTVPNAPKKLHNPIAFIIPRQRVLRENITPITLGSVCSSTPIKNKKNMM